MRPLSAQMSTNAASPHRQTPARRKGMGMFSAPKYENERNPNQRSTTHRTMRQRPIKDHPMPENLADRVSYKPSHAGRSSLTPSVLMPKRL